MLNFEMPVVATAARINPDKKLRLRNDEIQPRHRVAKPPREILATNKWNFDGIQNLAVGRRLVHVLLETLPESRSAKLDGGSIRLPGRLF